MCVFEPSLLDTAASRDNMGGSLSHGVIEVVDCLRLLYKSTAFLLAGTMRPARGGRRVILQSA